MQTTPDDLTTDALAVPTASGLIALRTVLLATLYFEGGHTAQGRAGVAKCLEAYLALTRKFLRWTTAAPTHRWVRLEPQARANADWILALPPDESWQLSFQGGASQREASDFRFEALGTAAWEAAAGLSYVHLCVPMDFFAQQSVKLPQLLLQMCEWLHPCHGYGGLGLEESYHTPTRQAFEPTAFGLLQRFPGLEADYPIAHSMHAKAGIKGVNWLTVLGEPWLERVGGLQGLRSTLDENYTLQAFTDGVLVQAGPHPSLGDRNRNQWPQAYVKLARRLRPVRLREHRSFNEFGPNRFDEQSTQAWLTRFDEH